MTQTQALRKDMGDPERGTSYRFGDERLKGIIRRGLTERGDRLAFRKSDWFIVVKKSGNTDGAKGPGKFSDRRLNNFKRRMI
jgi:hypothetical protein